MKCGYRPTTPPLASLLARRQQPGGGNIEFIVGQQQAAARREWLRQQQSNRNSVDTPPGMPVVPVVRQAGVPEPYRPPAPGQVADQP